MIRTYCSNCSQKIKVPESYAGRKVKCLKCKNTLTVPSCQINSQKPFYVDLSFWSLVVSNLIIIFLAIKQNWPVSELMWVYWAQSVIIGIFWFFKIITLVDFSTRGVKFNGKPLEETHSAKFSVGLFFLLHYGFFHFGYYEFLNHFSQEQSPTILPSGFWFVTGLFFANHLFSFIYNFKKREHEKPNMGTLMAFPYARIIPMHLTIVLGGYFLKDNPASYLIIFLLLKMFADVLMYAMELRGFQDKPPIPVSQKNPLKIVDPPRGIPFLLKLILFLGANNVIGYWILFAMIAVVYFVLTSQEIINRWWASLFILGPCVLLVGLYNGFQCVWLLINGRVGLARVVDIEEKEGEERSMFTIYYEFLASDGKTYDYKTRTDRPELLIDEDYEVLFYHPQKPSTAVLMDYLPGGLEYNENGNIVIGRPVNALLHLLPAVVVTIGLIVFLIYRAG